MAFIKTSTTRIFSLLLVAYFGFNMLPYLFTNAQSSEKPDLNHFNCKKVMMVVVKKQLKVFGECSREHKDKYSDLDEYQQKIQCIVKCGLDKENLLDEEKQITASSIQHFLDAHVPQMFHEMGHLFVDNCKAQFDGKLDAQDENCTTYGEFVKCMQNTIADIC